MESEKKCEGGCCKCKKEEEQKSDKNCMLAIIIEDKIDEETLKKLKNDGCPIEYTKENSDNGIINYIIRYAICKEKKFNPEDKYCTSLDHENCDVYKGWESWQT